MKSKKLNLTGLKVILCALLIIAFLMCLEINNYNDFGDFDNNKPEQTKLILIHITLNDLNNSREYHLAHLAV